MHRFFRIIGSTGVLLVTLLFAVGIPAVEAPEAETPAANPAKDELMRMAGFLSKLERFSVVQQSGYDLVQDSGQKIELAESRELVFIRPDRFRVDVQRSDGERSRTVFNGKEVTVFSEQRNLYASSEIQGNIDETIKHFVKDVGMRLPLAMLFVASLPEEIDNRVREVETVETALIDDDSFYHLAVRADTVDFQVWIPTTGDPLPRRIVITYKHEEGQPQYWANFSDWNLAPDASAALFSPDLPKDATRISFLAEIPGTTMPLRENGEEK